MKYVSGSGRFGTTRLNRCCRRIFCSTEGKEMNGNSKSDWYEMSRSIRLHRTKCAPRHISYYNRSGVLHILAISRRFNGVCVCGEARTCLTFIIIPFIAIEQMKRRNENRQRHHVFHACDALNFIIIDKSFNYSLFPLCRAMFAVSCMLPQPNSIAVNRARAHLLFATRMHSHSHTLAAISPN